MMFIDNPVGTGYSIADSYRTAEWEIGQDFVNFLVNFYNSTAFKGYQNTPLYIFGESYAGHYVPTVSQSIIWYNNNGTGPFKIPLKGMGVGDGWTDPIN